jgi:hypothetical protein
MELFAKRTHSIPSLDEPRANFDNFFSGFLVVFSVLTEENWDGTMF